MQDEDMTRAMDALNLQDKSPAKCEKRQERETPITDDDIFEVEFNDNMIKLFLQDPECVDGISDIKTNTAFLLQPGVIYWGSVNKDHFFHGEGLLMNAQEPISAWFGRFENSVPVGTGVMMKSMSFKVKPCLMTQNEVSFDDYMEMCDLNKTMW